MLLEIIDTFLKVEECKISIPKLVTFLYAHNKVTSKKMKNILMDKKYVFEKVALKSSGNSEAGASSFLTLTKPLFTFEKIF